MAKPHYLCNAEHAHPSLLAELELKFQDLNKWMVKKLRILVHEAELALRQSSVGASGKENGKCESSRNVHDC